MYNTDGVPIPQDTQSPCIHKLKDSYGCQPAWLRLIQETAQQRGQIVEQTWRLRQSPAVSCIVHPGTVLFQRTESKQLVTTPAPTTPRTLSGVQYFRTWRAVTSTTATGCALPNYIYILVKGSAQFFVEKPQLASPLSMLALSSSSSLPEKR